MLVQVQLFYIVGNGLMNRKGKTPFSSNQPYELDDVLTFPLAPFATRGIIAKSKTYSGIALRD